MCVVRKTGLRHERSMVLFIRQILLTSLLLLRSCETLFVPTLVWGLSALLSYLWECIGQMTSEPLGVLILLFGVTLCSTSATIRQMQRPSLYAGFKKAPRCRPSSPVVSKYGGAAAFLYGEALVSLPVLHGTVAPSAKYSHCYYGPESEIVSSTIESDSIIIQLPMNLILPSVTVKDLRRMVSMHNIQLPSYDRSRAQLSSQLLYHERMCTCGIFVSVIKKTRSGIRNNDQDCGTATSPPSLPMPSALYPTAQIYKGGILAATPLTGESLVAFPVLLGNVSVTDVYYHREYRCEADISLSSIEEGSLIIKLPMSMVISSVTVKEMRRMASLHEIRLPRSCRTREQVIVQLLDHEKVCSCPSFVSVVHPSQIVTVSEDEDFESALICSLDLGPYLVMGELQCGKYEFVAYDVPLPDIPADDVVYVACPTRDMARFVPKEVLQQMCHSHDISVPAFANHFQLFTALRSHICSSSCSVAISQFLRLREPVRVESDEIFPPAPLSRGTAMQIAHDFCKEFLPENFEEQGCAVCGELSLVRNMVTLDPTIHHLNVLVSSHSRLERHDVSDPIVSLQGPVLAAAHKTACPSCSESLANGIMPLLSLANGSWVGEVPDVLSDLSFAEKLLIARIRHNRCLVKVASGRSKMISNCVMYSNPIPEVYNALPPPRKDFEEVLAFLYVGSEPPTADDFRRTPMLVRRNRVKAALEWLKLNHSDYSDIDISWKNLSEYPESGIPVQVISKIVPVTSGNTLPSEMSMHDLDIEKGTSSGLCPFTVTGVSGEELDLMSTETMKAVALRHLESYGKILAIGRSKSPVSMYDNAQSYPQMFPWLFPYGKGGIGQAIHKGLISEDRYKKHLLMYFDKRFQKDPYFPMVAFNHSQIKKAVTGSFLMAAKNNFPDVVARLNRIDSDVLLDIIGRLIKGEHVHPETEQEKLCYTLFKDIDLVGGRVPGSLTSKKYMRNEVWSMTAFQGSPNWFITLSPADSRHPLCIYYAGTDIKFRPEIKCSKERDRLIAGNPVAAARFFHVMIKAFITHVLRWDIDDKDDGVFGKISAYFGTVEQQGRLTLHLHLLVWVVNAISPLQIRERLLAGDEDFQKALLNYLESCQKGEFLTGSMDDMKRRFTADTHSEGIHALHEDGVTRTADNQDPTLLFPIPPPSECCSDGKGTAICDGCDRCDAWWTSFESTVDHLLFKCNVHRCIGKTRKKTGQSNTQSIVTTSGPKGCLDEDDFCTARFPRDTRELSVVDADGHIDIKKMEAMLNTFLPLITFLFLCNIDVTSLLSGSALKAVIAYVTDYITKQTLKTHQIFQSAYDILKISQEELAELIPSDSARRIILKIVNSLTTKSEIGSPFASLYLMDHPDRYSSHPFTLFRWAPFVKHVSACWIT